MMPSLASFYPPPLFCCPLLPPPQFWPHRMFYVNPSSTYGSAVAPDIPEAHDKVNHMFLKNHS